MIGARDLAFPRLNLASWYIFILGGAFTLTAAAAGGVDTGWTFYTPLQQHLFQHPCRADGCRGLYHRLLLDSHRAQLHCHDSQNARTRHDLVSPAAFHLGALRHQHYFYSWHASYRHHVGAGGARTDLSPGNLRSRVGRRSGAVSASLLVLFASRGLHHDSAGHGCRERAHRLFFAQADLRLQRRRLRQPRPSR